MKTILFSITAFTIAGAVGGYFQEASALQRFHAHGMPLPLQDWLYESIQAAIAGVVGCFAGLVLGLVFNGFVGGSMLHPANR